METQFNGFVDNAFDYLIQIRVNNSREWFQAHKKEYEAYLLKPFQELVTDISEAMLAIDPLFEVRPAVSKTISRIFRDTRFSNDKSIYRSNMWFTFKRPQKEWLDAPSFFFEISPDAYRFGMGYYSASRDSMDVFRQMIDENPEGFLETISFFSKQDIFTVQGDVYKRSLYKGQYPEIKEWYDRKNIYLVHNSTKLERVFEKALEDDLIKGFKMLEPIYNYFWKVNARKLIEA